MQLIFNTFSISNLGVFAWLVEQITWLLGAFANLILTLIQNIFSSLFYSIATQLFKLIDFVQSLFSKLIGLEPYWYNGTMVGEPNSFGTDPAALLLSEPIVLEALTAMMIVGVVVLIMLSIIQIVKIEYTPHDKEGNTKGRVFGQAIKSLALFVTIPVLVFFGITASNYLLRSVAGALDLSGGGGSVSSSLFKASATDANWANNFNVSSGNPVDDFFGSIPLSGKSNFSVEDGKVVVRYKGQIIEQFSSNAQDINDQQREIARKIDAAFGTNAEIAGIGKLSINDPLLVNSFYDLGKINYLILYIAGVVILYFLFLAAFGLVVRLYKIVAYFIISPPMIAIGAVNNKAFGAWKDAFIAQVLSAYGTVAGINLFLITVPLIQNIELFDPSDFHFAIFNSYVHLIMIIAGCFLIKELIGQISGWIGGASALSEGTNVANKAMSAATTVAMGAGIGGAVLTKGLGVGATKLPGVSRLTASGQARRSERQARLAENYKKKSDEMFNRSKEATNPIEKQKMLEDASGLRHKSNLASERSEKAKKSSENISARTAKLKDSKVGRVLSPAVRGLAAMSSMNALKSATGAISEMATKPAKGVLGFDGAKPIKERYAKYKKKEQESQASRAADIAEKEKEQQRIVENATKAAQAQATAKENAKVQNMVVEKLETAKTGSEYDGVKKLVEGLSESLAKANYNDSLNVVNELRKMMPIMDKGFGDFVNETHKMTLALKEGNKEAGTFSETDKIALLDKFNSAKSNSVVNSQVIVNAVRDKAVDELSDDLKADLKRIERQIKEEIKKSTKNS